MKNDRISHAVTTLLIEEESFHSGGYLVDNKFRLEILIVADPKGQRNADPSEGIEQNSQEGQMDNHQVETTSPLSEQQHFEEENVAPFEYHRVSNDILR